MVRNLRIALSAILLTLSALWSVSAFGAEVTYGTTTSDSYAVAWSTNGEDANALTGDAWTGTGGGKLDKTSNLGDKLVSGSKTYVRFTLSEGDEITINWYHTSSFSGKTFTISWHNPSTDKDESVATISANNPTSKVKMSSSWTATSDGTFYLSFNNTVYIHSIVLPDADCTARTLSFTPASLSPTKDVATALPVASASAGTGTITYTMDGSDVTSSIGSYTFTDETSHTYKASIAADATYCKADATMTITAAAAPLASQTISVATDVATAVANGLTTVTATASGYSGSGAITYTITKPDATEIHTATFVVDQVGDYKVKATIAADATYAAATSSLITVTGTACTTNTVTLTLSDEGPLDLDASETTTLTAASATSDGAVTISGTAGLTAVGQTFDPGTTGSFTIVGTVAAAGNYCVGTATKTISVTSASEPVCATYTATRASNTSISGAYSATTFCTFTGFGGRAQTQDNGKLGDNGHYFGLTGTTFAAGDVITIDFSKPTDLGNGMFLFAGNTASADNLITTWNDGYTSGTAGTLTYTLSADDATKINAAGGVSLVRSSDYAQNPFMNSMQVKRCKVCTSPAPSVVVNTATASFAAGCSVNLPSSNLTITNASSVEYSSSDEAVATVSDAGVVTGVAAGTATITATAKNECDQCVSGVVTVTVGAGSSYTVPATATVPNFTTPTTVTLVGTSLTNPVTVTVPSGLTVKYSGTLHAGASSFNIPASEANAGAELSISGTTLGDYNLGFSTTTACGTLAKTTVVTVRNVAALPCPVLGEATALTYSGGTLNWTKLADETYVSNYRIQVLKNNVVQFTLYANKGESSTLVAGLEEGTTYTFKVFALSSDENTRVSSVGCTAGTFTTAAHPAAADVPCISEGFESLIGTSVKPVAGATNQTELYNSSNTTLNQTNSFSVGSGVWEAYYYCGYGPAHTGDMNFLLRKGSGAGDVAGYLKMPDIDNPIELSFYVKYDQSFTNSSHFTQNHGLRIEVGGSAITSGIYVDDVELPTLTTTTASSYSSSQISSFVSANTGCLDEYGNIKLTDTDWHKVSLDITSAEIVSVKLQLYGNRTHAWLDDFTVTCAAMEMTVTPAVTGLNYVPGLGPSEAKPFVLTGTGMPLTAGSGTVTMTANTGTNFEISTDGGNTFTQTSSYVIPYNAPDFTKTFYVRLKDGLAEGTYSDLFTFTATGYTKQAPTMTTKGSVTDVVSTIACGVTERIAYLSAQDGSYRDRVDPDLSWVASDADAGVTGFVLATGSTLTSPAIYDAANVQLEKLTFYYQISSGGNNTFSYQIYDGSTLKKNGTFENCTTKTAYPISIDIADVTISDNLKVVIVQGAKKTAEVWDVMITASGKKDISFSEPTMELHSSQGCTSDPHMFKVYGTCLDDDSKIVVYSDAVGKYQFSLDGSAWQDDTIKYAYVGEYTTRGTAFYVRLADDAPGGSSVDEIHASNDGKGLFTAYIVANVTSSSSVSPADGSVINVTSTKLGEQIVVIPIVAGELCNDLVVTSSCAGVTISDCYNGTYGNSVTYSAIDSTRAIYLKFTPGSVSSCNFTMTSGSSIDVSFTVNFDANAVLSPGHFDVNMAGAKDLTSSKFEFSLSDPAFEDFHAKTDFEAGDLVNTTLFVRTKGGVTAGDSETFTFGTKSVTITAQ